MIRIHPLALVQALRLLASALPGRRRTLLQPPVRGYRPGGLR